MSQLILGGPVPPIDDYLYSARYMAGPVWSCMLTAEGCDLYLIVSETGAGNLL